jgi:hypothetical protein
MEFLKYKKNYEHGSCQVIFKLKTNQDINNIFVEIFTKLNLWKQYHKKNFNSFGRSWKKKFTNTKFNQMWSHHIRSNHYEKLCLWQLDYPITKTSKRLIDNYIATIAWKHNKLINKMSDQKIKELYCNYKLVEKCIFI